MVKTIYVYISVRAWIFKNALLLFGFLLLSGTIVKYYFFEQFFVNDLTNEYTIVPNRFTLILSVGTFKLTFANCNTFLLDYFYDEFLNSVFLTEWKIMFGNICFYSSVIAA